MSILTKQKVMSQVMSLMESGLTPEEIAKTMQAEREKSLLDESESDEEFPTEIRTISQALAFRHGTTEDIPAIWKLLNRVYKGEISGPEAFRDGEAITLSSIQNLFADSSYQWLLMEAPNGFSEDSDGLLLGVCCFSADGVSRKNGEVEGILGSIRYLGVLPRYHGLCVGLRLLRKVERDMTKLGCVRILASLPSPKLKLLDWIERRGYQCVNEMPYPPSSGHQLTVADASLLLFVKSLKTQPIKTEAIDEGPLQPVISTSASKVAASNINIDESLTQKQSTTAPQKESQPSNALLTNSKLRSSVSRFAVSDPIAVDVIQSSGSVSTADKVDIPEVD